MMRSNPPTFPHCPTLVRSLALVQPAFGSLGGFAHDSLRTRKGGDSRPYEPLHILPSSQKEKKDCKNERLTNGNLSVLLGRWEDC